MNNLLFLTPLEEELSLFLKTCTESGFQLSAERIGRLPVNVLPELGMTVAHGGAGKVQFAVQTQHLLDSRPAWEVAGGVKACRFSMVPYIEIRAITDTPDHNAPADFESNLAIAMGNISRLITNWLQHSGLE